MIGKLIANRLKASPALLLLVSTNNIYPYVANEGTTAPLIIYVIESLDPVYDKDGWVQDECNFNVITYADNYSDLQDIAKEVRAALELQTGVYEGISVRKIYLRAQSEGYSINEDLFVNRLSFRTIITDY